MRQSTPARAVAGYSEQTGSRSIAVTAAISWRGLEDGNDMKLTKEQFEREGNYRLAVAVMRTLRGKGLLTEVEYCKANERLVDRYNPVWGHLPDVVA